MLCHIWVSVYFYYLVSLFTQRSLLLMFHIKAHKKKRWFACHFQGYWCEWVMIGGNAAIQLFSVHNKSSTYIPKRTFTALCWTLDWCWTLPNSFGHVRWFHQFTHQKGLHQYRYFLSTMHTPIHVHVLSVQNAHTRVLFIVPHKAMVHWSLAWRIYDKPFLCSRSVGTKKTNRFTNIFW